MTRFNYFQLLSVVAVVLVGCGGADDGGGTGDSKSGSTVKEAGKDKETGKTPTGASSSTDETAPGPSSPAVECVPAGTKGNALGIGAYCQAATDCASGTFCTAGLAPKGAEFCTAFCTTDAECGEGASCYSDPRGKACAPTACLAK